MLRLTASLTCMIVLAPLMAVADDTPTPATLDRQRGVNGIGASLSYVQTEVDSIQFGLGRLDLYGERSVDERITVYGQLSAVQGVGLGGSSSSLSNVELGAAMRRTWRDVDYVVHAGVVLPTAHNANDRGDGRVAQAFASYGRMTDQPLTLEDVTWMRVAASPIARRGRWFARVDVGVDIPVFHPEYSSQPIWRIQPETQGRLNASAGVDLGPVFVAGGVTTLLARKGVPMLAAGDERSLFAVAAATIGSAGADWNPSLTVATPLTGDVRGNLWSVTAGVRSTH